MTTTNGTTIRRRLAPSTTPERCDPASRDPVEQAAQQVIHHLLFALPSQGYMTFAELGNLWEVLGAPQDLPQRLALAPPWPLGVVLWDGVTPGFFALTTALQAHGELWLVPCSVLAYIHDGLVLDLPIAHRLPEEGFATPHWYPMCVRHKPPHTTHNFLGFDYLGSLHIHAAPRSFQVPTTAWSQPKARHVQREGA